MSHTYTCVYIYTREATCSTIKKKTKDFKVPLFIKYLPFLFIKHFKTNSRLFNYRKNHRFVIAYLLRGIIPTLEPRLRLFC